MNLLNFHIKIPRLQLWSICCRIARPLLICSLTMEQHSPETTATKPFGPGHIIHPQAKHTHTIILLHGRGSTAEEFAEELSESNLSGGKALQEAFPGWKWVFPSSKEHWNTTFQEFMPEWFEAQSLADPTMGQHLQIEGIRDSVSYVNELIEKEVQVLGGKTENVVIGGISQGGTIALWTLLSRHKMNSKRLGAFVGASTWLPFARNIRNLLSQRRESQSGPSMFDSFVMDIMGSARNRLETNFSKEYLETPIFLGHGTDDAYVDVDLGREAMEILSDAGFNASWKEYTGAEQEGHWLKVPEEIDDIKEFLTRI
ncbi:Phospholipase/carboxylesterase [Mariannaea sp. PMI_226]|nr:Phospholipase/carboxylesterase [Mariannaea sp. PMI_226]